MIFVRSIESGSGSALGSPHTTLPPKRWRLKQNDSKARIPSAMRALLRYHSLDRPEHLPAPPRRFLAGREGGAGQQ
jgi:hypothetical protein